MSPYNPNANWTAKTDAGARAPTYYIAIEGLTTKHYATAPVRAAGTTKKLLMNVPSSIGEKVKQLHGRQSISSLEIELIDRDGDITDLVATEKASPTVPNLVNRRVTLYSGYADLDEADFAEKGRFQVSDVKLLTDGVKFKFVLRDLKRHQQDDVFTNAEAGGVQAINTELSADANAGVKTLSVATVAGIDKDAVLFIGPSSDATDSGDEEKATVLLVSGTTLVLKDALVSSYKKFDEVRWATAVIEGNPINLIYSVLTGDFSNGTFPLTKVRGLPTGLGIAASDIDISGMLDERDKFLYSDVLRFERLRDEPGFRFLEGNIYRFYGFPVLTGEGKLSFRCYRPPFASVANAGLPSIAEADIVSWEWERAHALHINRVRIGVDVDPETGDAAQEIVEEDVTDQSDTKETAELELLKTGFRAGLRGVRLSEERGVHLLRRFKIVPPILKLRLPLSRRGLLQGEAAEITHSLIPNVKTGTRGLMAARMEIVERTEDFRAEMLELRVQDANYVRPAAWAPDSYTFAYASATAAQKEYAAWAPDAGNFADGGSPYQWV